MNDKQFQRVKVYIEFLEKKNEMEFRKGVEFCIDELRKLQDQWKHQRHWNFSDETKFAPVELSDYLVREFKKSEHFKKWEGKHE